MEFIFLVAVLYAAYKFLKYLANSDQPGSGKAAPAGGVSSAIQTKWQMSEAAVVIQNLLENCRKHGLGDPSINPPIIANQLVAAIWNEMPDTFNGTAGPRPHKLATAAISLANGFAIYENNRPMRVSLFLSLGQILKEVERNASAHGFHPLDEILFKTVNKTILEEAKRMESTSIFSSPQSPLD